MAGYASGGDSHGSSRGSSPSGQGRTLSGSSSSHSGPATGSFSARSSGSSSSFGSAASGNSSVGRSTQSVQVFRGGDSGTPASSGRSYRYQQSPNSSQNDGRAGVVSGSSAAVRGGTNVQNSARNFGRSGESGRSVVITDQPSGGNNNNSISAGNSRGSNNGNNNSFRSRGNGVVNGDTGGGNNAGANANNANPFNFPAGNSAQAGNDNGLRFSRGARRGGPTAHEVADFLDMQDNNGQPANGGNAVGRNIRGQSPDNRAGYNASQFGRSQRSDGGNRGSNDDNNPTIVGDNGNVLIPNRGNNNVGNGDNRSGTFVNSANRGGRGGNRGNSASDLQNGNDQNGVVQSGANVIRGSNRGNQVGNNNVNGSLGDVTRGGNGTRGEGERGGRGARGGRGNQFDLANNGQNGNFANGKWNIGRGRGGQGDHRDWSGKWNNSNRLVVADRVRDDWKRHDRHDGIPFYGNWWNDHHRSNHHWDVFLSFHGNPYYWWNWCPAPRLATWFSFGWPTPYYWDYGYGEYLNCYDGVVYVNGQWFEPAPAFYQQTVQLVESAPVFTPQQALAANWLPLGVFAVTLDGQANPNLLVQLAVTQDGVIGGTALNQQTGVSYDVTGTVDKQSQRAVWSYTDASGAMVMMESSIFNLTQPQATGLIHFGPDNIQVVELVRLEEPAADAAAGAVGGDAVQGQ